MQQSPEGAVAPASVSSPLNTLARLKLNAELAGLLKEKAGLPAGPMSALKGAKLASQILVVLGKLGVDLEAKKRENEAFALEGGPEPVPEPRKSTAHLYDFDPNRKTSQRRKDNGAAMELLRQIDKGEVSADALTDSQKETLARYSGTGGNLVGADGKKGSAYEYYTPKPIAAGMWSLLTELGFKGGKTLDPCAGVGIFGATAPENVAMEAVELNETSGRVNQLLNSGPGHNVIISPFESIASRTADEQYDAVVSNVPFGGVHDRGANRRLDSRYQDEPLETYFILRSLEKLKPGGLAAFIVPPRVVSAKGGREEKLRIAMSYMAEFMGAYRLPNLVFGTADADTITDVIVLRKYGRDAMGKIAELKEQNPAMLVTANVQWTDFVSGNYFMGEGRRFVLGEFVAKDPIKFLDVDRVVNTGSVTDIAKMLRKFPGSRVDWVLLNATETEPIAYNEGDTMTMAGQTLQMQGGVWVALGKASEGSRFDEMGQLFSTPVTSVLNKVTWDHASQYVTYLRGRSMDLDMPDWLRGAYSDVQKLESAEQAAFWNALSTGLAVVDVMQRHGKEQGFNYAEEYPGLSGAMQVTAATARKGNARLSRASKDALIKIGIMYDRKEGFSPVWTGQVASDVMAGTVLTTDAQVKALKYTSQGIHVDVVKLKEIFGPEFDPIESDEWCVSADGTKATKADDYYSGNLGDFLVRIDAGIAAAQGPLKAKLLRQKAQARERVDVVDPAMLRFNLFSPFVSAEEKAEFLRRFMHPSFVVGHDEDGEKVIMCDIKSPKTERERQLKRFAEYLKKGNLSTRTSADEARRNPQMEEQRRKMLREMAATANAQFDQWTKSNPLIMERMREMANDPARVYFREVDDTSDLGIEGFKQKLHPYQSAEVRKRARSFGGVNGFDVGLGKTFTALACAQYVHSIGVKKKTIFVVPNTVLSNWRREASAALESLDDCLFVGLDIDEKTGKARVDSSNYARDFNKILQNKHRKIFCSLEAFKAIPLKDATIDAYEAHLARIDPSFAPSDRKADSERANSKLAQAVGDTGQKSGAIPFFEDMGIDSIVIDEAHTMKNSKNTVEFSGAKFLSVADASQRGLDVQMKAWYVRGLSPLKDGVLALTATPITNSPLEIYSMLCLSVGEEKVHDLTMGAAGADQFMAVMCSIEEDDETSIDGITRTYRVFRGLQNVKLLRSALSTVATIKTGEDVKSETFDLKLPNAPEIKTEVVMPQASMAMLIEYQMAYRGARELIKGDRGNPKEEDVEAMQRVAAKFGEPMELIAHPFNLINKMTMVIADPELDERATFYQVTDQAKAEKVMAAFNKLNRTETRRIEGPWTQEGAVIGSKTVKDGESEVTMLKIKVQAALTEDGRVVIDTMDTNYQGDFERLAEKEGLELDVSIPPKLAALLDNVRQEEASPRSKSGRVKQIIFCDILPLHNKIKRLLTKRAGIPASAIAIVSGQTIKNPEQMQGIQDGFNAEGEDNKYRSIVANEKAEVGINLQKGTQAIHHLTIGWTPDSQHQRNGRGVRQGNDTAVVNIYHYDADGTFDAYRRNLTDKKADWIGSVMDAQGGNDVAVAGGLSNEQYDELINAVGDASAITRIRERAELREILARSDSARARQIINIKTASAQRDFVAKYADAKSWITERAMKLYDLRKSLRVMEVGLDDPKRSASALIKLQIRVAEARARIDGLTKEVEASATFHSSQYYGYASKTVTTAQTLTEVLDENTGYEVASKVREAVEKKVNRTVTVTDGGPLDQEWQAEIASAEAMQAEALKDFERIAMGPDSAYPAQVISAYKDGHVSIVDGSVYAKGMFVRMGDGSLGVIRNATDIASFPSERVMYVADAVTKGLKFIMFGTPEYEEALNEAARLDDAAEGVTPDNVDRLFTAIVPEVGERRTKATRVAYKAYLVTLNSPLFKYPLTHGLDVTSAAFNELANAQASVILDWGDMEVEVEAGGAYQVKSAQAVGWYPSDALLSTVVVDLAEHAKAYGTPFTMTDYRVATYHKYSDNAINGALGHAATLPVDAVDRINAASSEDEVMTVFAAIVQEAVSKVLVIPEGFDPKNFASYEVREATRARALVLKRQADAEALTKQRAQDAVNAGGAQPVDITATKSVMRLASWSGKGLLQIYFNDLPGMVNRKDSIYAYQAPSGERDWAYSFGDMTYTRREQFTEAIETELIIMNGGKPVITFAQLKELAGINASISASFGAEVSASGLVGLTGQTLPNMSVIKTAAAMVGGAAQWMGRNGGPLQWNVPQGAWEWIKTNHPEVAKQLQAVPA